MPKRRAFGLILVLAVFGAGSSWAAEPVGDSNDERLSAATHMLSVCGDHEQFSVFFSKTADLAMTGIKANQKPTMSDDQWAQFSNVLHADLQADVDSYAALIAAGYASHMSVADINAITDFCRTPAGQHIAAARSKMEADMYDIHQSWIRGAITSAVSDAQQKVQAKDKGL
jgi:hypothetical protein